MKKYQIIRFLLAVLCFLVLLYFTTRSASYYVPGRMAFLKYCAEHSIDSTRYAWVNAKTGVWNAYLDFAPNFGASPATYRAIIPLVGKPSVITLAQTHGETKKSADVIKGYFNPVPMPQDAHMRRVDYIEAKLGIRHYDFKFSIPRDKKLIAAFSLEVNGAPFPAGSGIYEIMPPSNAQSVEQWITISFFAPGFSSPGVESLPPQKRPHPVTCDIRLDGRYSLSFLIPKEDFIGQHQTKIGEALDGVEIGKNYEVWSYAVDEENTEKLRFTLTVRIEALQATDPLGKVNKK